MIPFGVTEIKLASSFERLVPASSSLTIEYFAGQFVVSEFTKSEEAVFSRVADLFGFLGETASRVILSLAPSALVNVLESHVLSVKEISLNREFPSRLTLRVTVVPN